MNDTQKSIIEARISLQRALLGEVFPALRAVVFSLSDHTLDIRFYSDGPISPDDKESVSCVETEVLAMYEPEYKMTTRCIRLDYPSSIDDGGMWVYKRRE